MAKPSVDRPEWQSQMDRILEQRLRKGGSGPYDGGDGGGTDMERIARLETKVEHFEKRFDSIDRNFELLNGKLDRLSERMLTRWDVAIVTGMVIAALGAAAIYGPRLVALIPTQ